MNKYQLHNKPYCKLLDTDLGDLIKKSKYIDSLCVNIFDDYCGEDYPYPKLRHQLPLKNEEKDYLDPDNWALTDEEKETVIKYLKDLSDYAQNVFDMYPQDPIGNHIDISVLPPWIVFPAYRANDTVWITGPGQRYHKIFGWMIGTKREQKDEFEEYKELFPMPAYIENDVDWTMYYEWDDLMNGKGRFGLGKNIEN